MRFLSPSVMRQVGVDARWNRHDVPAEPPEPDPDPGGDCRHGCNGYCVSYGSERCNFTCHPEAPAIPPVREDQPVDTTVIKFTGRIGSPEAEQFSLGCELYVGDTGTNGMPNTKVMGWTKGVENPGRLVQLQLSGRIPLTPQGAGYQIHIADADGVHIKGPYSVGLGDVTYGEVP